MALTTEGKNILAEKLRNALSNTGGSIGFMYLFVMDSTYSTSATATTSTTGYVANANCSLNLTNNIVSISGDYEIDMPTGSYAKYLLAIARNSSYASAVYAKNTIVSDTLGTSYEYGGKFVVTDFEFEVN